MLLQSALARTVETVRSECINRLFAEGRIDVREWFEGLWISAESPRRQNSECRLSFLVAARRFEEMRRMTIAIQPL